MSRTDFYHLQSKNLEEVLPSLLNKAYTAGKKVKVKVGNELRVSFLNAHLWTYEDESFLPHGTAKDGFADLQPIFISADNDNPNEASFLFLVDGADLEGLNLEDFERIFYIFDGKNAEALNAARKFWKTLKDTESERHYWQQNDAGKWEEK